MHGVCFLFFFSWFYHLLKQRKVHNVRMWLKKVIFYTQTNPANADGHPLKDVK